MNYQPMRIRWIYEQDEQITSYAQRLPKKPCTCNFHHAFLHTIRPPPSTERNANKNKGYDVMKNFFCAGGCENYDAQRQVWQND